MKKIAVIIPLRADDHLSEDEVVSLRHARHYLKGHDPYLIVPKGTKVSIQGFRNMEFPTRFFGSAAAHARLLSSAMFYRKFTRYEHVLFYHLDSLIFSKDITTWAEKPYDYIGAPWMKTPDSPWVKKNRVGNGGFALLRVRSALRVLKMRHRMEPKTLIYDAFTHFATPKIIDWMKRLETMLPHSRVIHTLMEEWRSTDNPAPNHRNNDVFWSDIAKLYDPDFRIAPFEEGLAFAFEVAPRDCYQMNGARIPLGCHAWTRYDRSFWEPLLLPEGA